MNVYSERFWSYVLKTDTCWLWQRSLVQGYGQFWDGKKNVKAHRFAYMEAKGPIPQGLHLDHLCRVPACVRPEHLEAVTPQVNCLRGIGPAAKNAFATHCRHGHPMAGENLMQDEKGYRKCRECYRANYWRKNQRKAQAIRETKQLAGVPIRLGRGVPYTHCLRGHVMDQANTYQKGAYRRCRTCQRELMARRRTQT